MSANGQTLILNEDLNEESLKVIFLGKIASVTIPSEHIHLVE